ncbi:hypothetical protein ACOMHN_011092 [Nucella lapillus]
MPPSPFPLPGSSIVRVLNSSFQYFVELPSSCPSAAAPDTSFLVTNAQATDTVQALTTSPVMSPQSVMLWTDSCSTHVYSGHNYKLLQNVNRLQKSRSTARVSSRQSEMTHLARGDGSSATHRGKPLHGQGRQRIANNSPSQHRDELSLSQS